MLAVTALRIKQGHEIEVTADGPDEEVALETLRAAVESGLGEPLA
jgi:phosphotransferase system HPr-like phosphotransfer protein